MNSKRLLGAALSSLVGIAGFLQISGVLFHSPVKADPPRAGSLVTACSALGCERDLKVWEMADLSKLQMKSSVEKDPVTGKMVKWDGILLSKLVEDVLKDLALEHRAQIDLIVLRGKAGDKAVIPRALITKYPILLALNSEKNKKLENRGLIYSVMPWTSKPRILGEELPLERYFIPQVNRIELTNYRQLYDPLYLKRRTDPSAMRGEKIFVQNCVGCHSEPTTTVPTALMGAMARGAGSDSNYKVNYAHPSVQGGPKLSERDIRSIWRYLEEFKEENVPAPGAVAAPAKTASAGGEAIQLPSSPNL